MVLCCQVGRGCLLKFDLRETMMFRNNKLPKSIKHIVANAVWKLVASLTMIVFALIVEHYLFSALPFS